MFDIVTLIETVRIEPKHFKKNTVHSIKCELNRRLSNKVMLKIGLGICIWDILHIGDSIIYPSDGAYYTEVKFRYVFLNPFINEVVIGTINKCSLEGIQVTLECFDDIIITPENISQPSRFDANRNSWLWILKSEEKEHEIFIDVQDKIIFKVIDYIWKDTYPITNMANENRTQQERSMAPFTVIGTIIGSGLGLPIWWESNDE